MIQTSSNQLEKLSTESLNEGTVRGAEIDDHKVKEEPVTDNEEVIGPFPGTINPDPYFNDVRSWNEDRRDNPEVVEVAKERPH